MTVERITDWHLLKALRLRALQDSPEAFGGTYAQALANTDEKWQRRVDEWACFTGLFEGEPNGLVSGYVTDEGKYLLISMWVAPDARGSGMAAELVNAVASWARGKGATHLDIGVVDENTRARRLYEKAGAVYDHDYIENDVLVRVLRLGL